MLGRCLLHRGIHAVLYEKASFGPRNNYAITLQPSAYLPLLKTIDVDQQHFVNQVAVDGSVNGTGKFTIPLGIEPGSLRVQRGKFEDFLREGLDVRGEHEVQGVTHENNKQLSLQLKGGKHIFSDVIIGADGAHSAIRRSFLPGRQLEVLPYVAFNGRRKIERKTFDEVFLPEMKVSHVIELKRGQTVLKISTNELTEDSVNINWIYSRPAQGPSDPLHRPNRSTSEAKQIPEQFFQEINTLKELAEPFADIFDAGKLRKERILHWLMRDLLVPLQELQELGEKGIWLVGDAAHTGPIIGGNGANMAILDALSMADHVQKHGVGAIASWYAERHPLWVESEENGLQYLANLHLTKESPKSTQERL